MQNIPPQMPPGQQPQAPLPAGGGAPPPDLQVDDAKQQLPEGRVRKGKRRREEEKAAKDLKMKPRSAAKAMSRWLYQHKALLTGLGIAALGGGVMLAFLMVPGPHLFLLVAGMGILTLGYSIAIFAPRLDPWFDENAGEAFEWAASRVGRGADIVYVGVRSVWESQQTQEIKRACARMIARGVDNLLALADRLFS